MIQYLFEFILRCDKANVTPAEAEIDAFLYSINRYNFRNEFILFCFYHWENRHDQINRLLKC